jgi:hypothetical protein
MAAGPLQKFYAAETFQISDDDWMKLPAVLREALRVAALRDLASMAEPRPPNPETSEDIVRRDLALFVGVSSDGLLRLLRPGGLA